jgi:mRNA-degrading endonuclease RelE of RelBE toxin-antitoxin system
MIETSFSERFKRSLNDAPERVKKDFKKQLPLLLKNLQYPSLRAKKYDEAKGVWQARVNDSWRMYFIIEGNIYYFVDIMAHPK